MFKKIISLLIFQFIVISFIYSASGNTTVYVTKTGNKYHTSSCSYLKKSKIPMKLSDAIDSGYSPCSKCNPPIKVSSIDLEKVFQYNIDNKYQVFFIYHPETLLNNCTTNQL